MGKVIKGQSKNDAWNDDDIPVITAPSKQDSWSDDDIPVISSTPQKKSPDPSAGGLPVSSTPGQNGSPTSNAPQKQIVELPTAPDPLTGLPTEAMTPVATPQEKTEQATKYIANHYLQNVGVPQGMQVNAPEHPLNQLTDPHGDPSYLSSYVKSNLARLQQKQTANVGASENMGGVPEYLQGINQEREDLLNNAGQIMRQQLFAKEVQQKKYDDHSAAIQMDVLKKQQGADIKDIDAQIEATNKWEHPNGVGAMQERSRLQDKKKSIQEHYGQQMQSVRENTKYNPIMIGAEYAANMGNPQAEKDLEALKQGKPINPASQYAYNQFGNKVIQDGTDATVNDKAKQEGEEHADRSGNQLYENNKPYIIQQAANTIGNAKYEDTNPLMNAVRMVIPSQILPGASKDDIQKYGEENGLDQKVIDELKKDPSQIPKQASLLQQFGRGLFNAAAPIYETGVRTAGHVFGGNAEAINEAFAPGWENQRGVGAVIAGNTPTDQNSFHNVTGAIGQIFEGAGNLATFAGEVGGTAKGLEGLGMTEKGAEKLANFGVMTLQGYNDSYKHSLELFGDKPEDEGKRQAFSLINGIIGGAIFSHTPKYQPIKDALGKVSKSGEQLIEEMQANGGTDFLETKVGKDKLTAYVQKFGSEMGTQVKLATAQKISEGIVTTLAAPDAKQDIPEDVKNTAISTMLTMLIPSILGAKGHVDMQSPLNHAAMFEMGSNPDKYINFIGQQLRDGKITPEQAQMSHDAILKMKNVIANTPTTTIDKEGNTVPLSPDQIKAYSYSLFQEDLQQKKLEDLQKSATTANLPMDKAQEAPLKKKISELQKQRDEILAKPAPAIIAPNQERSVATDAQPEPQASATKEIPEEGSVIKWDRYGNEEENDWTVGKRVKTRGGQEAVELSREYEDGGGKSTVTHVVTLEDLQKKSSEKEGNSENKNIPLSPQVGSQQKTPQDEKTNGESGQNEAGHQGAPNESRKEAGIQGNDDDQAGQERRRQGGSLNETEEGNKAEATPKEQPIPVSGRKRRKLVAEEEPVQQKEYAAMDIGTEAGKPQEGVDKKIKGAADNEKIGGGESFNEFKDRIQKAWENTKKTSEDKTQFMMHSTVMRLVEAAERVGWDSPNLREEFNNEKEPATAIKRTYDLDNNKGKIDLYRHGGTVDGDKGLTRTPDTPLTEKGKGEAKEIAADIKDNGIAPPAIVAGGDEVRTGHTAEIVANRLSLESEIEKRFGINVDEAAQHFSKGTAEIQRRLGLSYDEAIQAKKDYQEIIEKHELPNQGTEPSTERRNEVKPEPQAPATKIFTRKDIKTSSDYKKITKDFKKGDKITFHTDGKERTGMWDGTKIRDEKNNPWGVTAILSDEKDWIRNDGQKEDKPTKQETREPIYIARGVTVPKGEFKEARGGFYTHSKENAEGYADGGHVDERHINPDAKILHLVDGDPDNYTVNEEGVKEFQRITGIKDAGADITEALWGEPKIAAKLKKAGYDVIKGDTMDGLGYYVINTDATSKDDAKKNEGLDKKLSPNELVRKKQIRLNQLQGEHDDLTSQKEELESKISTAQATAKPNETAIEEMSSQLSDINKQIKDKQSHIKLKEREIEIQKGYANNADNMRKGLNKLIKDSDPDTHISGLSKQSLKDLLNHAIDLYEKFGNIHIAALKGVEWAKQHIYGENEEVGKLQEKHIRDLLSPFIQPLKDEPIIRNPEHLQVAKEMLADIENGDLTHEEARQDILESEGVSDRTKGNVLNWIDWHLEGRGDRDWETKESEKGQYSGEDDETSIKNDATRLRRAQFGLNEEFQAGQKEWGPIWDDVRDRIENKGYDPQILVNDLAKHPRPITDEENAVLLHHQVTLENKARDLNKQINEAAEKGDEATVLENKVEKAAVLDKLQQIYDVDKAVGTENARGLAARRMASDRKYTLTNMIAEKRATANDGKPLSEEQQAEIERLNQKIQETQDAYDAYVKQKEADILKLQRQVLAARQDKAQKNASGTTGAPGSATEAKQSKSQQVANKLRSWADKIEKKNKGNFYSSPIPITPKMVVGVLRLVADGIEKGGELLDHIQESIIKIRDANPGIDESHLEREVNQALIDAGVAPNPLSTKAKVANLMNGFFKNGKLDREAVRLNVAANRAKDEFDVQIKRDEQKNLSKLAKAQNVFIKWQRSFKLSNPLTMGKLFAAGFTRLVTEPIEDVVGGAYGQLLPKLAKGAIGEGGGLNAKEYARDIKNGLILGMKDASQIMKKGSGGKSDLDVLFGKGGDLPPEAIDFFGQLHSATKAPFKRAIFERKLTKRLKNYVSNGVDVSDPMVQTSAMIGAYKDANRAIFMQDNKVADWYQKQIRSLSKVDPETGKAPDKWKATAAQFLLPFVKVPTNIVAETARGVYGLPVGTYQAAHAYITKSLEHLSEDEKDVIMRNLKKGSIGAATLALGFFNPQNFGGYYQKGQKRDDDDAPAMGAKFGDTKLPGWLMDAPIWQLLQIGATVRRVWDSKVHGEPRGMTEGMMAGAVGLIESEPLVRQPVEIAKMLTSPGERGYFFGELAKSTLVPSGVEYGAKVFDPADERPLGEKLADPQNHRKPHTVLEHIESGIPGLRENLDVK